MVCICCLPFAFCYNQNANWHQARHTGELRNIKSLNKWPLYDVLVNKYRGLPCPWLSFLVAPHLLYGLNPHLIIPVSVHATNHTDFSPEEARGISDFILPMIQVLPGQRCTAREMIMHPWLAAVRTEEDERLAASVRGDRARGRR